MGKKRHAKQPTKAKPKRRRACILDSFRQFHAFGFKISLLVVDGASTNLTMLKLLVGHEGVFGHDKTKKILT